MKPIKIIDQSKIEKPNGQAKKNGLGRENERVEFKKSSGEVKDAMDDVARHCKDAIRPRIYPVIKEEAIKGFALPTIRPRMGFLSSSRGSRLAL